MHVTSTTYNPNKIILIAALATVALGVIGIAGYFKVGALNTMGQVNSIAVMGVAGTLALSLMILGVIHHKRQKPAPTFADIKADRTLIETIDTNNRTFFGPAVWQIWGIKVLDVVPKAPAIDSNEKNKVLLYVPKRIRVQGHEIDLTLHFLEQLDTGEDNLAIKLRGENKKKYPSSPQKKGEWIQIDKEMIGFQQDYATHEQMIKEKKLEMPKVLEAALLCIMLYHFGGAKLGDIDTYIRCSEKAIKSQTPIVVGWNGDHYLQIGIEDGIPRTFALGVKRFTSSAQG